MKLLRIIISDTPTVLYEPSNEQIVLDSTVNPHHCIGCFGCWVKTPGECIIKDKYSNMGKLLSKCDELVIISKCTYGGFSPYVKNVLDRSISYITPFFVIRNKETHHRPRYDNVIKISVYFYGAGITEKEKETAIKIVSANALNFNATVNCVCFHESYEEMKEALA